MSIVQHSTSVPTETSYVLAALSTVYSTATATPQHATLPQASSPQLQQYDVSTRAGADHFLVDFQVREKRGREGLEELSEESEALSEELGALSSPPCSP